ncbi:MAG: stage II sporulation protein M [Candidatus Eremiobacteraeota bacterium]|nr:stage II sporulation protein M [Candidatus Eremiobacteraeota bacterium]
MDRSTFIERRGASWERLESLLGRTHRGLRRLSPDELAELGRLYRSTTSDLAFAQGRRYGPQIIVYLNRLTARTHSIVYGGGVRSGRSRIARFFAYTFPYEFRRSFPFVGMCMAITVVCASAAYAIVMHNPADAYALLPAQMLPGHIGKSLHDSNFAIPPVRAAEMSSLIIANNLKVAFIAFSAGIVTLGTFTLYEIITNGLMVGGLGALYGQAGFGYDFWATVAPHGVIELTAITIAGGAGLLLAAGVLAPGRLRRSDALRENARRAGILVAGVIAMLSVAGTIEGFFSPLRFGPEVRSAVGIATAIALIAYFGLAGRTAPSKGSQ